MSHQNIIYDEEILKLKQIKLKLEHTIKRIETLSIQLEGAKNKLKEKLNEVNCEVKSKYLQLEILQLIIEISDESDKKRDIKMN